MNHNEVRERQWQETLEVAAALKDRPTAEAGSAPRAGELYLNHRTVGFPVEWLVIETDAAGRPRVVPVDDYPLAGRSDVALPSPQVGGSAVARCTFAAWTEASVWEPELRTGVLEERDIERVRARRRAVEEGGLEPTLMEEVADGDPDYTLWADGTLQQAVVALETEEKRVRAPRISHLWPALAAAAVLALVLGLAAYTYRLNDRLTSTRERVAELEQQGTAQTARIEEEAQQRQAAEGEAGRLEGLLREARTALDATGDQLTKIRRQLRQALDVGVVVNLPKLVFGHRERFTRSGVRGAALVIEQRPETRVFVEVEVVNPEPYSSYRLRLSPTNGGQLLIIEGLSRDDAWLRLELPGDELVPGEYDVLIDGLGLGKPVELDERYRLTVER